MRSNIKPIEIQKQVLQPKFLYVISFRLLDFQKICLNLFDTETSFHGKNLRWESTKNLEVKKLSVFLPEEYEVDRCVEKKVIH